MAREKLQLQPNGPAGRLIVPGIGLSADPAEHLKQEEIPYGSREPFRTDAARALAGAGLHAWRRAYRA